MPAIDQIASYEIYGRCYSIRNGAEYVEDDVFAIVYAQTQKADHLLIAAGEFHSPVEKFPANIMSYRFSLKYASWFFLYEIKIVFKLVGSFALTLKAFVSDNSFVITDYAYRICIAFYGDDLAEECDRYGVTVSVESYS